MPSETTIALKELEYAELAKTISQDQSRASMSIPAMRTMYTGFSPRMANDPILAETFAKAQVSIQQNGVVGDPVMNTALSMYATQFNDLFKGTSVSAYVSYLRTKQAYGEVPAEIRNLLNAQGNKQISDLAESENADEQRAYRALVTLRQRVREGINYRELIERTTLENLEALVGNAA
ncbi:MAG: hypothetical protein ABIE22_02835 [archaeon]